MLEMPNPLAEHRIIAIPMLPAPMIEIVGLVYFYPQQILCLYLRYLFERDRFDCLLVLTALALNY